MVAAILMIVWGSFFGGVLTTVDGPERRSVRIMERVALLGCGFAVGWGVYYVLTNFYLITVFGGGSS